MESELANVYTYTIHTKTGENMLELNHEYTYQEICRKLGWNVSSGAQKIKQIKVLEESYEFYHPENKKTHKPNSVTRSVKSLL